MMSVETLIKNSCQTTGEGPHWDERTQTLLYVDMNTGTVHRWNSETDVDEKYVFDETVSFVVPRRKGGYVIGLGKTICIFDWNTKAVSVLHTVDEGKATKFNDGKCDPSGRLWCGTMSTVLEDDPTKVEPILGSLYSLDVDGSLRCQKEEVGISNGLAWTEDNTTMYYIDSTPRKVYGYDFDIVSGTMKNERVVIDFAVTSPPLVGFPDGMTIDTDENIWVACFLGSKIIKFDPKSGQQMTQIDVPEARVTSCCFGGKQFDQMFITSDRMVDSDEETANTPLAGSVFRATGMGAYGKPAAIFEG